MASLVPCLTIGWQGKSPKDHARVLVCDSEIIVFAVVKESRLTGITEEGRWGMLPRLVVRVMKDIRCGCQ